MRDKQIDIVAQKAKELGIETTKLQYVLISKIMAEDSVDISPEDCMKICNLQRHCRAILSKDTVALEKERAWHSTPQIEIFKVEAKQQYDRITGEKLF